MDSKKRRPNFSEDEIMALINAVAERRDILLSKLDSNINVRVKAMQWQAVADCVNMVSAVKREATEVRKKFTDFRTLVKKKAAGDARYTGGTGAGPAVDIKYSPLEEAMLPLISRNAAYGLGIPESESSFSEEHVMDGKNKPYFEVEEYLDADLHSSETHLSGYSHASSDAGLSNDMFVYNDSIIELRKRRPNFSEDEVMALITAVTERKDILLAKFDANINTRVKAMQWQAVADCVNIVSTVKRGASEVRKKFADFRTQVKKKAADAKHAVGTGGGPAVDVKYSPTEEAMLPLISRNAVHESANSESEANILEEHALDEKNEPYFEVEEYLEVDLHSNDTHANEMHAHEMHANETHATGYSHASSDAGLSNDMIMYGDSMMESRRRRPNFSEEEIMTLITAVTERKDILLSKFDSNINIRAKAVQWQAVADCVNMISAVKREATEVRKKFADFRTQVKKKTSDARLAAESGGGAAVDVKYSPLEEAMLPLISGTAVHGLGIPESETNFSEDQVVGEKNEPYYEDYVEGSSDASTDAGASNDMHDSAYEVFERFKNTSQIPALHSSAHRSSSENGATATTALKVRGPTPSAAVPVKLTSSGSWPLTNREHKSINQIEQPTIPYPTEPTINLMQPGVPPLAGPGTLNLPEPKVFTPTEPRTLNSIDSRNLMDSRALPPMEPKMLTPTEPRASIPTDSRAPGLTGPLTLVGEPSALEIATHETDSPYSRPKKRRAIPGPSRTLVKNMVAVQQGILTSLNTLASQNEKLVTYSETLASQNERLITHAEKLSESVAMLAASFATIAESYKSRHPNL